jgi:Ribonucleotide reductase, all-alpha domain
MTDAAAPEPTSPPGQPRDELGLSPAALAVLAVRFLRRDAAGRLVESTGKMIDRVATHVAAAEDAHQRGTSDRWAEAFSRMMRACEFLPDSPVLMNAGGPSACSRAVSCCRSPIRWGRSSPRGAPRRSSVGPVPAPAFRFRRCGRRATLLRRAVGRRRVRCRSSACTTPPPA